MGKGGVWISDGRHVTIITKAMVITRLVMITTSVITHIMSVVDDTTITLHLFVISVLISTSISSDT